MSLINKANLYRTIDKPYLVWFNTEHVKCTSKQKHNPRMDCWNVTSNVIIFQKDASVFSLLHFCRQLYVFRVLTPIIMGSYNCNYSFWHWSTGSTTIRSRCWFGTDSSSTTRGDGSRPGWPVPEAVITVLRAPDDGCQHPKHIELPTDIYIYNIYNKLNAVTSFWKIIKFDSRCTDPWI